MAQQSWDRIKGAHEKKEYSVCFHKSHGGEREILLHGEACVACVTVKGITGKLDLGYKVQAVKAG